MNDLENTLSNNLDELGRIKRDLSGLEELLEDRPIDQENILDSMHHREQQMEEVQRILPKLGMFDTKRIAKKSTSLANDQLYKALVDAFDSHNKDLQEFKKTSAKLAANSSSDKKRQADELTRLGLKQFQLEKTQKHLASIQKIGEDRALQKAMLGSLFIWFEKGNTNVIPFKMPESMFDLNSGSDSSYAQLRSAKQNKFSKLQQQKMALQQQSQ